MTVDEAIAKWAEGYYPCSRFLKNGENGKVFWAEPGEADCAVIDLELLHGLMDRVTAFTRINRERANASRGITPKKTQDGYIVLQERRKAGVTSSNLLKNLGYETLIETSVVSTIPRSAAVDMINDYLTRNKEKLGIAEICKGSTEIEKIFRNSEKYEKLREPSYDEDGRRRYYGYDDFCADYQIVFLEHCQYNVNYVKGIWEVQLWHTRPLEYISQDLLPKASRKE